MAARKKKASEKSVISSMTGFARGSGRDGLYEWIWELKCVNGRGLDIRCRTPNGFDMLEGAARSAAAARFSRGNLSMTLNLNPVTTTTAVSVNRDLLQQLLDVAQDYKDAPGVLPPRLDGLLAIRGVIEPVESGETPDEVEKRIASILATLEIALDDLRSARAEEGKRVGEVLRAHVDEIGELAAAARESAEALPAALAAKLNEQLSEILEDRPGIPEERLAQEVAALLVKADVREEVDRLVAHVEAMNELLQAGGAVGRRMDFLAQELNREANTLCSKASNVPLTRIGLELKAVIDRFREQVQNIE